MFVRSFGWARFLGLPVQSEVHLNFHFLEAGAQHLVLQLFFLNIRIAHRSVSALECSDIGLADYIDAVPEGNFGQLSNFRRTNKSA